MALRQLQCRGAVAWGVATAIAAAAALWIAGPWRYPVSLGIDAASTLFVAYALASRRRHCRRPSRNPVHQSEAAIADEAVDEGCGLSTMMMPVCTSLQMFGVVVQQVANRAAAAVSAGNGTTVITICAFYRRCRRAGCKVQRSIAYQASQCQLLLTAAAAAGRRAGADASAAAAHATAALPVQLQGYRVQGARAVRHWQRWLWAEASLWQAHLADLLRRCVAAAAGAAGMPPLPATAAVAAAYLMRTMRLSRAAWASMLRHAAPSLRACRTRTAAFCAHGAVLLTRSIRRLVLWLATAAVAAENTVAACGRMLQRRAHGCCCSRAGCCARCGRQQGPWGGEDLAQQEMAEGAPEGRGGGALLRRLQEDNDQLRETVAALHVGQQALAEALAAAVRREADAQRLAAQTAEAALLAQQYVLQQSTAVVSLQQQQQQQRQAAALVDQQQQQREASMLAQQEQQSGVTLQAPSGVATFVPGMTEAMHEALVLGVKAAVRAAVRDALAAGGAVSGSAAASAGSANHTTPGGAGGASGECGAAAGAAGASACSLSEGWEDVSTA